MRQSPCFIYETKKNDMTLKWRSSKHLASVVRDYICQCVHSLAAHRHIVFCNNCVVVRKVFQHWLEPRLAWVPCTNLAPKKVNPKHYLLFFLTAVDSWHSHLCIEHVSWFWDRVKRLKIHCKVKINARGSMAQWTTFSF